VTNRIVSQKEIAAVLGINVLSVAKRARRERWQRVKVGKNYAYPSETLPDVIRSLLQQASPTPQQSDLAIDALRRLIKEAVKDALREAAAEGGA
jgi:hypothetical protein